VSFGTIRRAPHDSRLLRLEDALDTHFQCQRLLGQLRHADLLGGGERLVDEGECALVVVRLVTLDERGGEVVARVGSGSPATA
jgi:hypothetical protein